MRTMTRTHSFVLAVAAVAASAGAAVAGDWLRFRGPNGSGLGPDDRPVPTKWSATENLKWKVPLPGPGSSSPIVVGDRVFVTCWTGYGVDRAAGEQKDLRRQLLCLDRKTGKTLWSREVEPVLPEDRYGGMFAQHGYASHTPASDGKRVFVFFGKSGVLAFDLEGRQLWQTGVGTGLDRRGWGSASSPILYKDLVIVPAVVESQSMVALNKETGKEVWRAEAGGFASTWGTPVLVEVDDKRTDLVLGVPYEIWGLNPDTGKLRWHCDAMETDSFCSSVVADKGVVYAIEGQRGGSIAVRAGGSDDVTKTHVAWSGSDRNRIGTPVVFEDRLYFVSNRTVNCTDAKTGKSLYQERLGGAAAGGTPAPRPGGGFGGRGGQDYSSPVVANGNLYYLARSGDLYVVKLGEKLEKLAVNRVTADGEDFSATPAISNGELFLRSSKHLYCVANMK